MSEDSPAKKPRRHLVKRGVVRDRDGLIRYLKAFGFESTDDPAVFTRYEDRKTHQKPAGARYYETVSVDDLLANPDLMRRFIAERNRKHPEIVKQLEEEAKARKPPSPPQE